MDSDDEPILKPRVTKRRLVKGEAPAKPVTRAAGWRKEVCFQKRKRFYGRELGLRIIRKQYRRVDTSTHVFEFRRKYSTFLRVFRRK